MLNRAFAGGDDASDGTDTRMRFRTKKTVYVSDPSFDTSGHCKTENYLEIAEYTPSDTSVVHVFICTDQQYIGWSYLPSSTREGSKQSMVVIHPDTIPGGKMQNRNLGYTLVHELGHYFNLKHTFTRNSCGRMDDGCGDTPAQSTPNMACSVNRDSCPHDTGKDPVWSYMDYSYDHCYSRFSPCQVGRIRASLEYFRPKLLGASLLNKPITTKATTQQPTTEMPTIPQPTTEKPTTQQPTTEKPTTQPADTSASMMKQDMPKGCVQILAVGSRGHRGAVISTHSHSHSHSSAASCATACASHPTCVYWLVTMRNCVLKSSKKSELYVSAASPKGILSHGDCTLPDSTPLCIGSHNGFSAGYGGCETYAMKPGTDVQNNEYCHTDQDGTTGHMADQVCPECGKCGTNLNVIMIKNPTPATLASTWAATPKVTTHANAAKSTMLPAAPSTVDTTATASPTMTTQSSVAATTTIAIVLTHPPCTGTPSSFDAGYGGCTTYGTGGKNTKYCTKDSDKVSGETAMAVCVECGACSLHVAPPPAVSNASEKSSVAATTIMITATMAATTAVEPAVTRKPICVGTPSSFDAGYGGCSSYADKNKPYCKTDTDKGSTSGPAAMLVCPECGKCLLGQGSQEEAETDPQTDNSASEVIVKAPTTTHTGLVSFSKQQGCCRTANGGTGSVKATHVVVGMPACQALCTLDSVCVAFEVLVQPLKTTCELHTEPTPNVAAVPLCSCFQRMPVTGKNTDPMVDDSNGDTDGNSNIQPVTSKGCEGQQQFSSSPKVGRVSLAKVKTRTAAGTLKACAKACSSIPACLGYAFKTRGKSNLRCQLSTARADAALWNDNHHHAKFDFYDRC